MTIATRLPRRCVRVGALGLLHRPTAESDMIQWGKGRTSADAAHIECLETACSILSSSITDTTAGDVALPASLSSFRLFETLMASRMTEGEKLFRISMFGMTQWPPMTPGK